MSFILWLPQLSKLHQLLFTFERNSFGAIFLKSSHFQKHREMIVYGKKAPLAMSFEGMSCLGIESREILIVSLLFIKTKISTNGKY